MSTEEKERERESKTVPKVSLNQIYSLLSNHTLQSVCVCLAGCGQVVANGQKKKAKEKSPEKRGNQLKTAKAKIESMERY